jgi:hypothetical protein
MRLLLGEEGARGDEDQLFRPAHLQRFPTGALEATRRLRPELIPSVLHIHLGEDEEAAIWPFRDGKRDIVARCSKQLCASCVLSSRDFAAERSASSP